MQNDLIFSSTSKIKPALIGFKLRLIFIVNKTFKTMSNV